MVDVYWVLDLFPRWRITALMESVEIITPIRNKMGNGGVDDDGGTGVRVSLFFYFEGKGARVDTFNTTLYFFNR